MAGTGIPGILHIGSGRTFVREWINVDIDPTWHPDIVWDASSPLPGVALPSQRFGPVRLSPGAFEQIVAIEVLEHVDDLCATMTNCLALLRDGGLMRITVPYDLSHGAWQDPTHRRAFNENSFAYFCEWFWYLGWQTHRFHKQRIDLRPSPLGRELLGQGVAWEVVARTPRAIDTVLAELIKRPLDAADHQELQRYRQARELAGTEVLVGFSASSGAET